MQHRISRRTIVVGTAASAAAGVLAACGGATSTSTASPAATSVPAAVISPTAARASSAVPTAAAGTVASGTAAVGTGSASASGIIRPDTTPGAFKGKRLAFFQRIQYYKSVQDEIANQIKGYAQSVGADVDLSMQAEGSGTNIAKVQAGVQAGAPFDLWDGPYEVPQLTALDIVTDVSDLVSQCIAAYGNVMPVVPRSLVTDGKYYAVPWFTTSDAWFARKDKLLAKGIAPESLDTYDKLRDAALEISDPKANFYGWGFSPYASGDALLLITHVIASWGGSVQDKTGTKVTFNSPETVAAITWLVDIYQNPKYRDMLPPGFESWDGNGNNSAYLNGTAGIVDNSFSLYSKLVGDKNPILANTALIAPPKGPAVAQPLRGSSVGGNLYIPRGAKNADLARETIKHLLQPDIWLKVATPASGLVLPAYESQWNNAFWKSDPNFAQLQAQVRDVSGFNGIYYPGPPSVGAGGVSAQRVIEDMMASIIQKGQKVPDAVKGAHDQMVKIYEQFGVKQ